MDEPHMLPCGVCSYYECDLVWDDMVGHGERNVSDSETMGRVCYLQRLTTVTECECMEIYGGLVVTSYSK